MMKNLLRPYKLNDKITLRNRVVMAPLTRCMADDGLVPTELMADYYGRRAQTGLIVTEAILISADGQGYPNTPGIFNDMQIQGWRNVTEAVHENGGKIFAQLWHTGRLAHPYFFNGSESLAPSSIGIKGTVPRARDLSYTVPKSMTKTDINRIISNFRQAASNAIEAGFDGVEIHGANGYLIDQFLHHSTNIREDEYGQSPANMSRFALQVIDEISTEISIDRTGFRLSPGGYFNLEGDKRDRPVFDYLLSELEKRNLAYLHVGMFDDSMQFDYLGGSASQYIRKHYSKTLIGVGNYTPDSGSEAIRDGCFDLLGLGRAFIANPDLVDKLESGQSLVTYEESMLATLY